MNLVQRSPVGECVFLERNTVAQTAGSLVSRFSKFRGFKVSRSQGLKVSRLADMEARLLAARRRGGPPSPLILENKGEIHWVGVKPRHLKDLYYTSSNKGLRLRKSRAQRPWPLDAAEPVGSPVSFVERTNGWGDRAPGRDTAVMSSCPGFEHVGKEMGLSVRESTWGSSGRHRM